MATPNGVCKLKGLGREIRRGRGRWKVPDYSDLVNKRSKSHLKKRFSTEWRLYQGDTDSRYLPLYNVPQVYYIYIILNELKVK